jgi:hypothetical protein
VDVEPVPGDMHRKGQDRADGDQQKPDSDTDVSQSLAAVDRTSVYVRLRRRIPRLGRLFPPGEMAEPIGASAHGDPHRLGRRSDSDPTNGGDRSQVAVWPCVRTYSANDEQPKPLPTRATSELRDTGPGAELGESCTRSAC